jgi:hypothetical protein
VTKQKVLAALEGKKVDTILPETCPALIGQLLRAVRTRTAAAKILGTSDTTLRAVIDGSKEMPVQWIVRAKAELGMPVIGDAESEPQAAPSPAGPPFVPWNGKKVTVKIPGRNGGKPRFHKGVPEPLAKLIEKYGGNISQAAAACGHTSGAINPIFQDSKKFKEPWQRKVFNALNGIPQQERMSEDFDKYTLGLAIVMIGGSAQNFDRINDIADILNGRLVFRKNTKTGWLIIYRIATEDLPRFKKLAIRDANEIVCP